MANLFKNRIKIVQYLYALDINTEFKPDDDFFEKEEYKKSFILATKIFEVKDKLDKIISSALTGYKINRLNLVDLAIIRNAVYEMIYEKLPIQIILNEAINITKILSEAVNEKQHQFNNKLLDQIRINLNIKPTSIEKGDNK